MLRLPNGQNIGGNLQVISLTGGLLSLPKPVVQGSQVKMIFLTGTGAVLGGAEMLQPVTDGLQPFRFVALAPDDHRRIGALVGQQSHRKEFEQAAWMEKLRAASAKRDEPRCWRPLVAAAVGVVMISLAAAAYLMHFRVHIGLLKQIGF